jgi:hypothetical protein
MKQIPEYEKDIASIRTMMERSSKFLSLSGLSGVLAGVYALAGAMAAYYLVQYPVSPLAYRVQSIQDRRTLINLVLIAVAVLVCSVATGLILSNRKAKRQGLTLWNSASKTMVVNLSIPLFAGGIFILIILSSGHFGLAAPACLLFYGIALIQGSPNTYEEVRYLGFCEIGLGLISSLLPGYGLLFWALGFGVLHIIYGGIMYNKYDK